MANQTQKKLPRWAVVLLVIFYPAGLLYLLCKWLNKNQDGYTQKANIIMIIAVLLIMCGSYYLIAGVTGNVQSDDPNNILFGIIVMLLFGCGGGIALLVIGSKYRKLGKLYKKYTPVVLNGDLESLDEIASAVGVSFDEAAADLQQLMGKGAWSDRYIDHRGGRLVWTKKPAVKEIPKENKTCPHCGAVCQVTPGQDMICAYCDSPLS